MSCLFCPDDNIPEHLKYWTQFIEKHHIQGRRRSEYLIPACHYHHNLITDNKIDRQIIVDKANRHYGYEKFYLPYPESKRILTNGD